MTTANLLLRLRNLLNEASAGFYTDAQLYAYLDSAQNFIIQNLLCRQNALKDTMAYFEYKTLKTVLKQGTISTTTANSYSLSSLTDFIQLQSIEIYNASPERCLQTTEVPYMKLQYLKTNTYQGHTYNSSDKTGQVYYSLRGTTIQTSFSDSNFPNSDYATLRVNYYYQPSAIASGVEATLEDHTHESIINLAFSYALKQDGRTQEAFAQEQLALQTINTFN